MPSLVINFTEIKAQFASLHNLNSDDIEIVSPYAPPAPTFEQVSYADDERAPLDGDSTRNEIQARINADFKAAAERRLTDDRLAALRSLIAIAYDVGRDAELAYGYNKIGAIKAVRLLGGIGLKDAKDLVEATIKR